MTWQAITAIATFVVAFVALLPIWFEFLRRRAGARSLRIRVAAQLIRLRLFYLTVVNPGTKIPSEGRPESMYDIRDRLTEMMVESSVMTKFEQDLLGIIVLNYTALASLWASGKRGVYFKSLDETAPNQLKLVEHLLAHFGESGFNPKFGGDGRV